MVAIAPERPQIDFKPGYRGFLAFVDSIGEPLAPFQRRIARAHFNHRKVAAILPKGNFKTTTCALIGLHHLLTVDGAEVRIGAASRRQAEICLRRMKVFARHPLIANRISITYFELRHEETGGELTVVSADGEKLHGDSPTLLIGDEVWAWSERAELLEAMESSLMKRPDARLILISTAAPTLDSPLGRLRSRALAQSDVKRRGVVTEAKGPDLHWFEWSLSEEEPITDTRKVKQCNPAAYITPKALREQRLALPEAAFAQFHCNRWGVSESQWLPPGAWAACAGKTEFEDGERVWVGLDVGADRSASAVVWVNEQLHIGVRTWTGDDSVLDVAAFVPELARRYSIVQIGGDDYRSGEMMRRWEERGLRVSVFPMNDPMMVPASQLLYDTIIEQRLRHPDDPVLNQHVANAIAKHKPRGWRIAKQDDRHNIDAVISLCIAVNLHARREPPKPEPNIVWV